MSAGRLREFDKEAALESAMTLFWRDGYSGTSMSDLTAAMGINKPSLYSAFGNKEALFISSLNQFVEKHGVPHARYLLTPNQSLRQRLELYLKSIADMASDTSLPGGCFITLSSCEARSHCLPDDALQEISKIMSVNVKTLTDFFSHELQNDNLVTETTPEVLANYLLTLQNGLTVMARSGVKRNILYKVIDQSVTLF